MTINQLKTSLKTPKSVMKQEFQCKFCNTKFHKESTLVRHVCVKKQRSVDLGSTGPRFGLRAYQRFYELTANSKKPKTAEEFIDSPYYIDFVKFGNHLALLKPVYIEKFIDFVILGSFKLKDWTSDAVYYVYVEDLVKKEPAVSAAERTILEITRWCDSENSEFNRFFIDVNENEAAHLIKTGKISPWVLYLSGTGNNLFSRFNEEHTRIVERVIDPAYWMKKFKTNSDDVKFIKTVLKEAGL